MSILDDLTKLASTDFGKMVMGIVKDATTNHVYPYLRKNIQNAATPVDMSEDEQQRRANDEFASIDPSDLPSSTHRYHPSDVTDVIVKSRN